MDMPKTPIGGSSAWTVPQVMQRDDWVCRLSRVRRRRDRRRRCARRASVGSASRRSCVTTSARPADDACSARSGRRSAPASASATSRACRSSAATAETLIRIYGGSAATSATRSPRTATAMSWAMSSMSATPSSDHDRRLTQSTAELCFHRTPAMSWACSASTAPGRAGRAGS